MKQLVAPLMGQAAKGAEEATPALREAALNFMCAFTVRVRGSGVTLQLPACAEGTTRPATIIPSTCPG